MPDEYLIALTLVDEVDNQGLDCPHCGYEFHFIEANVYIPAMDGYEEETLESCLDCLIRIVQERVTDTSRKITVEVPRAGIHP